MFDISREITAKWMSGGVRATTLHWPDDRLWIERSRKVRFREVPLGRKRSRREAVGVEEANLAILNAPGIYVSGDQPVDGDDATAIIEQLDSIESSYELVNSSSVKVLLKGRDWETEHVLRFPTRKQVNKHKKHSIVQVNGKIEYQASIEAYGLLFDEIVERSEGYAGAVPILHKDAAVDQVMAAMDDLLAEDSSPEA